MLSDLSIRNVAIIKEINISFGEGLSVFTGETGAGKSILIESLLLALGGRASTELIRTGETEAEVSALFHVASEASVIARLEEAGLPFEGELLLRRVISSVGRSRAYINDRPVTISLLRSVGQELVEISNQHEHQHLLNPRFHLELLDLYGNLLDEREAICARHQEIRQQRNELRELGGNTYERQRRQEYLLYQVEELDQVDLDVDEQELEEERRYLMQLEKMLEVSQGGEELLYSGQGAVIEMLGRLQTQLQTWGKLSETLQTASEDLSEAQALVDEIARNLRNFVSNAELNPQRLEEVEAQLSQLRDLKRKHGVLSVEALRQTKDEFLQELQTLKAQEEHLSQLEASYNTEVDKLWEMATKLSKRRKKAAKKLSKEIEAELVSVGMKKATFAVDFTVLSHDEENDEEGEDDSQEGERQLPASTGQDHIQFLLSSNPGEEPRSLQRVASGGELSRIMLSLKQILQEREPMDTCVFDEVDSGIGGFAATIVGQKIKKIAASRQVICITHLPQLACFADHHFHIQKRESKGRTRSSIQRLTPSEREKELARMLGGVEITTQSRAHARELLEQAKGFLSDLDQAS